MFWQKVSTRWHYAPDVRFRWTGPRIAHWLRKTRGPCWLNIIASYLQKLLGFRCETVNYHTLAVQRYMSDNNCSEEEARQELGDKPNCYIWELSGLSEDEEG